MHVIVFFDGNLCSLFEICQPFGFRQPGYGGKFTKLHGIKFHKTTNLLTAVRTSDHGGCCIYVHRTTSSEFRMADMGSNLVQPTEHGQ